MNWNSNKDFSSLDFILFMCFVLSTGIAGNAWLLGLRLSDFCDNVATAVAHSISVIMGSNVIELPYA